MSPHQKGSVSPSLLLRTHPLAALPCLLPSAGCCKWAATLRLQRRHIVTVPRHHLRSPQQLVELATSPCGVWRLAREGEQTRGARRKGKQGEARGDKRKADWLSWEHGVICCLTFHCFPTSNWVEIELGRSKASWATRREERKWSYKNLTLRTTGSYAVCTFSLLVVVVKFR